MSILWWIRSLQTRILMSKCRLGFLTWCDGTERRLVSLRAIVRRTLATNPPSLAACFSEAARERLLQTNATSRPAGILFTKNEADGRTIPGPDLRPTLIRARTLYGAGLGFASLRLLAVVVKATQGHMWDEGGYLENILAEIDADISQALQSSREELDGGRVGDMAMARQAMEELRAAVKESQAGVEGWGGVYPFDRAAVTLDYCKV
ncbi:unnamed protein product [Somion occarium]|uniref:Uncharacterized protein n=1 Tax=Somion occarium TaxID=3059160 RepID=A0ABP1CS41_9APHY